MPQPSPLEKEKERVKIKNIVAKSLFFQPFSISQLSDLFFSLDASNPYQPRVRIVYGDVKFSVLRSGTVIARAAYSFDQLQEAFDWLRHYAQTVFKLQLSPSYQISNIVAVSPVSQSNLNLLELAPLLPHSSYDPSPPLFNCTENHINPLVFYFNADRELKPRSTALIFHTGNAILTGFFSLYDLLARASQLSSLMHQISLDHPEVLGGTKN